MLNESLKVDLITESRASFDHLLARLQAMDAEHALRQTDAAMESLGTSCALKPVESDALKLYLASASALLKAGEALIDTRSGVPAHNRAARMADLVGQTKEACRTAYRAALLITDS